jgi:hypothetical protein
MSTTEARLVATALAAADEKLKVRQVTLLTCSECGKGHYASNGDGTFDCTSSSCAHWIDWLDLTPEYNEVYDLSHDGRLGYYLKTLVT